MILHILKRKAKYFYNETVFLKNLPKTEDIWFHLLLTWTLVSDDLQPVIFKYPLCRQVKISSKFFTRILRPKFLKVEISVNPNMSRQMKYVLTPYICDKYSNVYCVYIVYIFKFLYIHVQYLIQLQTCWLCVSCFFSCSLSLSSYFILMPP